MADAITYHHDIEQGSGAWLDLRKGRLTASNVGKVLTPTLKLAGNSDSRRIVYQMVADQVTDFQEEHFVSWDMARGHEDELVAADVYADTYPLNGEVQTCGFVTRDDLGFPFGYSPDGLVGPRGLLEVKSRLPALQIKEALEHLVKGEVPPGDRLQVQAGLLATNREWCDYVLFSAGVPMLKVRAVPDRQIHDAIIAAGLALKARVDTELERYRLFAKDFPATAPRPPTMELAA